MLNTWLRNYATKRTVPYAVKNSWVLPSPAATKQLIENPAPPTSWGSSNQGHVNVPKEWRKMRKLPEWKRQMFALKEKFSQGWDPKRKLSREEMDRLREIKAAQPRITLNELGERFRISPEAVRRIVKSRWRPNEKDAEKIEQRWLRRGERLGSRAVTSKAPQKLSGKATNKTARKVPSKVPKGPGESRNADRPYGKATGRSSAGYRSRGQKLHDPGQDIF